jgi:hypothetical protein
MSSDCAVLAVCVTAVTLTFPDVSTVFADIVYPVSGARLEAVYDLMPAETFVLNAPFRYILTWERSGSEGSDHDQVIEFVANVVFLREVTLEGAVESGDCDVLAVCVTEVALTFPEVSTVFADIVYIVSGARLEAVYDLMPAEIFVLNAPFRYIITWERSGSEGSDHDQVIEFVAKVVFFSEDTLEGAVTSFSVTVASQVLLTLPFWFEPVYVIL